MEDEKVLNLEDLDPKDNLTQEDLDYIDDEMNKAVDEAIKEIEDKVENDEELDKETEEIFSTDDVNERIKIWQKYHPNENFFG